MKYDWKRDPYGSWICDMPNAIRLVASPSRTQLRNGHWIAARGANWTAQCSIWDAASRTVSRYGRDAWREQMPDAETAKALAVSIYETETAARKSI